MSYIPLSVPNLSELEAQHVNRALESGFVSSVGPDVSSFEETFARYVGAKYAVACASGTAALHVALQVVGVTRERDVICADFTFAGSGNPIAYLGAQPVFVDSEWRTWNMDPQLVVEEIERRAAAGEPQPAAVEIVHVLGQPADAAPILEVCARYGIPVVEDAAESLGARWSSGVLAGRHTGTVGTIGCFSFNGNKIATTGGGGMVVTDDAELAAAVRHLTTQAKVPGVGYLHDVVGYNYRLTNLAAALGNAQLARIDDFVAAKRRFAARYDQAFSDLPLVVPPRVEGFDSTYWLYSVLTADEMERDRLLEALDSAGIGARALWRPLHMQPAYGEPAHIGGHVGRALFERGVSLPSSTGMTDEEQDRVIAAVRDFFGAA
ncbi:DegT/DnrJ/EryC1/StrS family aminotransferase [Microbacterium sediminis]|uniref:DegT/DnrJ/EryC1/StrS aminotransferase n=1 Tax=Microbacterium sediminis TaxID=904291 RepID=A0A1B9NDL7_9MICO|nr:DegT/DnrJ/EryC1/StrS family aminotransferase [Microbacterium sediminis]OCG74680.1 DegT/DnrJ/EryC1/StrS aminotransferase [Microbacterium sediminis]